MRLLIALIATVALASVGFADDKGKKHKYGHGQHKHQDKYYKKLDKAEWKYLEERRKLEEKFFKEQSKWEPKYYEESGQRGRHYYPDQYAPPDYYPERLYPGAPFHGQFIDPYGRPINGPYYQMPGYERPRYQYVPSSRYWPRQRWDRDDDDDDDDDDD